MIGSGNGSFFFFLSSSLSLSLSLSASFFSSGFGLSFFSSFSFSFFLSESFFGSGFFDSLAFDSVFFSAFLASVFGFGFAASVFTFSLYSAKSLSYFFHESTYFFPAANCFSADAIAVAVAPDSLNLIATGSPITRASFPSLNATTGDAVAPVPASKAVVMPFSRAYSMVGSSG